MALAKELVKGRNVVEFYPELHDKQLMEDFLKKQEESKDNSDDSSDANLEKNSEK